MASYADANKTLGITKAGKRPAADGGRSADGSANASKRQCTGADITACSPGVLEDHRTRIVCVLWANDPEALDMDRRCRDSTWPSVQRMKADHLVKKPHSLKLPELPTKVNNQARTQKQQFDEVHHWLNPDAPFAVSPYHHERHLVEEQRQRERREVNTLPQQPPANIRNYSSESPDVFSGELGLTPTAQLYTKVTRLEYQVGSAITQLRRDFHQSKLENYTNFENIFEGLRPLIDAQPGGRRDTVEAMYQEDEHGSQPRSSTTQKDQPYSNKAVGDHCITDPSFLVSDQPKDSSLATPAARCMKPHSAPDPEPFAIQQMYPYCCLPGPPCAMHATSRAIPASHDVHPSSLIDRHGIGVNAAREAWQDQYAASDSPYSALPHSG